jgi:hypothetical protein
MKRVSNIKPMLLLTIFSNGLKMGAGIEVKKSTYDAVNMMYA